jgi:uncharacterized protein (UPF0147 family)
MRAYITGLLRKALVPIMVRKKKMEEYEERIKQAINVLGLVAEDTTTPRNIRRAAKDSITVLQGTDFTPAVRASNAISLLDEILQDPNMPQYTRVKLWNVMSVIEAIKD